MKHLSIADIKKEISLQGNSEMFLKEDNFKQAYMESPAVKRIEKEISDVLTSERISCKKTKSIIGRISHLFIPPGAKGSIRGLQFNKLVKMQLERLLKSIYRCKNITLSFEQNNHNLYEKADWILTKKNKNGTSMLIGYNQLDLWDGGAQINRASKYILDDLLHSTLSKKRIKMVSVIARKPPAFQEGNKIYKIFDVGFRKKRLFYVRGLMKFVKEWAKK